MHQVVANGYVMVIGSGAVLLSMALTERSLVRRSSTTAQMLSGVIDSLIPWLTIGGFTLFVWVNPLL
jgi:hypothetical protein